MMEIAALGFIAIGVAVVAAIVVAFFWNEK
jgi:hypothetical protein